MARKDKKIKYQVIFEDKPCSYEECVILYKQLFLALLRVEGLEISEMVERVIRKAFPPEFFKDIID